MDHFHFIKTKTFYASHIHIHLLYSIKTQAVKLASIIQNGMQPPVKIDVGLLKFTSISTSNHQFPKWVNLQSTNLSPNNNNLAGVCRTRWLKKSPILRAKGVEQEEESVSSDSDIEGKIKDVENYKTSVKTVALCVIFFIAVTFGVGVGLKDGIGKASEFFAGYLLEQSLSVDNLFVFVLIFKYFKVPLAYQNRVLSYGIAGAIIFRLSLILLGTATLQRFEAVNLLLASILLYSSFQLFFAGEDDDDDLSDNFIVKTCQKIIPVTSEYDGNKFFTVVNGAWKATPLLLTVAVIELSDIAFAVDSIPAVFGVTRDPFIVFSSNLFAILGLRSLYTLISESMGELEYLQPAIGIVLGFIGCKMILDFFGYHVSTEVSLGCVATTLSAGVLLSLLKKSD
ncbi:thylakoid membrane protein TERC, chloroplastic-like [Bidens hawaiensis]|uniref:thylakoid membrane protein TERC, chloroplastic-like n=1 Tax=Bidens hawaiensis TaxID=980011 RepID=UPI00404B7624